MAALWGRLRIPRALVLAACVAAGRALAQPCALYLGGFEPLGPVGSTVLGTWDFDRDGRPDLLLQHEGVVTVALNGSGGAFTPEREIFVGSVVVGDFDGDGIVDVVGVQRGVPTPLVVFLKGDGRGKFQETSSFRASSYLSSPVAGDFDGDGKLDLAGLASASFVWWYPGDGRGGFGLPLAFQVGFPYTSRLFSMDVDGDGRSELLVSGSGFKTIILATYSPSSNGAAPGFKDGPDAGGFECGFDFAFGDVDGDGLRDAVSVNRYIGGCRNSIRTFLVRSGGGLQLEQEAHALHAPVLADVDGDGRLDLAALEEVVDYSGSPFPYRTDWLSVQPGDGTGLFGASVVFPVPFLQISIATLVAADFDGDGRTDLILSGAYNSPPLLLLNTCASHRPAAPGPPTLPRRRTTIPPP